MGFPTDFFPVLFAIPRIVGWLAHWREAMRESFDGGTPRIWRPRQIYIGNATRLYTSLEERTEAQIERKSTDETLPNTDNKHSPSLEITRHPFNRRYVVSKI
jgi:citrate synthase